MGALNEYIRQLPNGIRSVDPLLSSVAVGEDHDLVRKLGKDSIGSRSTFDKLHDRGAQVKFLFLGAAVGECFTYTHYVEERLKAPYRYNREFTGQISNGNDTWEDTYALFVRYKGVRPSHDGFLEKDLLRRNVLRQVRCGASSISCINEPDAYETICDHLRTNPNCYISENPRDFNREFSVHNMISL